MRKMRECLLAFSPQAERGLKIVTDEASSTNHYIFTYIMTWIISGKIHFKHQDQLLPINQDVSLCSTANTQSTAMYYCRESSLLFIGCTALSVVRFSRADHESDILSTA